jgi:uncharacterized damage-inducible protein DinB
MIVLLAVAVSPLQAQHMGELFVAQQDGLQEKLVGLAEAIPADKYGWSPSPGVRTVAQVLTHVAGGNYMFPQFAGTEAPAGFDSKALAGLTDKAAIVAQLKESFAHSRKAFAALSHDDVHKEIKMFGRDTTVAGMLMLMANHQHEHLGQLIAYGRSNGVVPPWSK